VPENIPMYYIDPNPALENKNNLKVISESATIGVKKLIELLKNQAY
jgi:NAD-dependent deacetylase